MATLDRLVPPAATPLASAWVPRRAIATALFIVVAIALLQVAQSSGIVHTGQTLLRLERQKTDLEATVRGLEAEVASLSSLERVDRAARDRLGMVAAESSDYVSVSVAAPAGVFLPRPIIAVDQSALDATDPWWQPFIRALPFR